MHIYKYIYDAIKNTKNRFYLSLGFLHEYLKYLGVLKFFCYLHFGEKILSNRGNKSKISNLPTSQFGKSEAYCAHF